ncbi:hypothetical protein PP175_07415 [Aneurinibacillus sp. Ricciae_BoGa-3]|uniref:hypothetical protein n=1 Tax=Aneurinibacillus sp. Ricciae_BoGa-3 TaxID=3022697 RepID=UPI002340D008|nr:hypothetical protein [Aneurinibacillus sp. Ricciae_BoGa-3]WCK55760.1 hypothetical protein PP175_07415 [Aneurinibacillus sp. Ricciae_BoGa-3]
MRRESNLLFFIVVFVFWTTSVSASAVIPVKMPHESNPSYHIELAGWASLVKPQITTEHYEHATYTHYYYRSSGREFRLTTAAIDNGDVLYFARNFDRAPINQVLLKITAADPAVVRVALPIAGKIGSWKTAPSLPTTIHTPLYVDGRRLYYRIGNASVFHPLGYTVLQEKKQAEKPASIIRNNAGVTYSIPLPSSQTTLAETWGILSAKPLVKWDQDEAASQAMNIGFDNGKMLSLDGAYSPDETTYTPYQPGSFYRNPANGEGLHSLPYLNASDYGTIFNDVATHLGYCAVKTQNTEGCWPTYPRSNWLYSEYKTSYTYIDNRRNADNATFLLRLLKNRSDDAIAHALTKWDAYQKSYILKTGLKIGSGLLIPDYVGGVNASISHTALNHQAANMNYLYERYLQTNDPDKKVLADLLLKGIENTAPRWVKSDHDLYYALRRNLSPHPNPDYYELTRDDLDYSQSLLLLINGVPSEKIQYLIDEKNTWIAAHPVH